MKLFVVIVQSLRSAAREGREINGLINYTHGGEELVGSIVLNFL